MSERKGRKRSYELPSRLGARLDRFLMSVDELAKEMEVNPSTLGDNLRGDNRITLETALKLLKALKYDMRSEEILLLKELADAYYLRHKTSK